MQVYQLLVFSPLERLPKELLHEILVDLSKEDLLGLRRVSKTLARETAPFLFQIIPAWLGSKSLERLTALSEHPQISQYIGKIVVSPLRFVEIVRRAACFKMAHASQLNACQGATIASCQGRLETIYNSNVRDGVAHYFEAWQSGLECPMTPLCPCVWQKIKFYGDCCITEISGIWMPGHENSFRSLHPIPSPGSYRR